MCVCADNTKAVLMFTNEAHHLVSDALEELVEVIAIVFLCFMSELRR